jgi:hypothetical protein
MPNQLPDDEIQLRWLQKMVTKVTQEWDAIVLAFAEREYRAPKPPSKRKKSATEAAPDGQ